METKITLRKINKANWHYFQAKLKIEGKSMSSWLNEKILEELKKK